MKQCMLFRALFWLLPFLITVLLPPASPAQEKKSLRIVFVSLSWNNQLPFRIAIAKGFFKDQGLAVEQIFVRGGPTAIAALVSGNVDFASIGGAQAPIRSNARGLDLQIIASLSNYTNYTLLGSKEAKASKSCAARSSVSPEPARSPTLLSGSSSRETTSILIGTSPSGPSAEPHCALSHSNEESLPPRRSPPKIRSACSIRVSR